MDPTIDNTKLRIFLAGVRLFAAKGYKGATVRDICRDAEAANLNAINYYFNGKEGLYRTILEAMFGELGKRWDEADADAPPDLPPEERLRRYVRIYCSLLYAEQPLGREFTTIFLSEMVHPSPFLAEATQHLVAPQTERFMNLILELLGPNADQTTAGHCLVSVLGPLLYPAVVWPAAESFFQAAVTEQLDRFIDHAFHFALAGIQGTRNNLAANQGENHE